MLFGRHFVTIASPPASLRAWVLRWNLSALLFVIASVVSSAQNPGALTNETIIKLVASGVPTETVIKTIQSADTVAFRFLPGDLQQLSQYRVPDEVVKAMAAKDKGAKLPLDTPAPLARAATPTKLPVKSEPPIGEQQAVATTPPVKEKHGFATGNLLDVTTMANRSGYRFAVFVVRIGDLVYTGEGDRLGHVTDSLITFAVTRSGDDGHDLIVGDPIEASIDRDHMVILKPNGKELKTKIIKRERAQ